MFDEIIVMTPGSETGFWVLSAVYPVGTWVIPKGGEYGQSRKLIISPPVAEGDYCVETQYFSRGQ
jgi:hypothetical protein